jgi:hypothetical protein
MKRNMRRLLPVLAILALAGCVVAAPPNPYPPPPAPRVEVAPPPPRETVVWEPGRWHWDGHGYVWIPGHYIERVVGRHWEQGRWNWDGHEWQWIGGHWA